jgi:hypothetical protein
LNQLRYQHEGITRITLKILAWFIGLDEALIMPEVVETGAPIECHDLDESTLTYTFEMTNAHAYALCSVMK